MLEFKKLDIDSMAVFDKYLKNKYENSETSFPNLYIWNDFYNTMYAEEEGFLVVLNTSQNGKIHCYMPYGEGDMPVLLARLKEYVNSKGQPLRITNACPEVAGLIKALYPEALVRENVDFNDYVYLTESLINLSGKALHAKKNHLNKFKSSYEYTYRTLTKDDFEECISLASCLILKSRMEDSFSYHAEIGSIEKAFGHFDELGLCGGVIVIDGKIRAFTVGEALTEECALIHIEKADTSYNGIYAAINNEFVKNRWADFKYINREEDMGICGLRKAKLSYKPHHMVRKYICIVQ